MKEKCSTNPPYKYYEVHCYGDNDAECYLATTDETVARGFALSQIQGLNDASSSFRFNCVHFDELESFERLCL